MEVDTPQARDGQNLFAHDHAVRVHQNQIRRELLHRLDKILIFRAMHLRLNQQRQLVRLGYFAQWRMVLWPNGRTYDPDQMADRDMSK